MVLIYCLSRIIIVYTWVCLLTVCPLMFIWFLLFVSMFQKCVFYTIHLAITDFIFNFRSLLFWLDHSPHSYLLIEIWVCLRFWYSFKTCLNFCFYYYFSVWSRVRIMSLDYSKIQSRQMLISNSTTSNSYFKRAAVSTQTSLPSFICIYHYSSLTLFSPNNYLPENYHVACKEQIWISL